MREPKVNDFTKDELKIILLEMDIVMHRTKKQGVLQISPIYFELRNKIKSMIDNYKCDHESDGLIYTSNPPQNKCKKCGEFYR
jgi:hypothetical protein